MANWPTAPLIRIKKGRTFDGTEIENSLALRGHNGDYRVAERWLLRSIGDRIDEWEEIAPVPTVALKRLQDAFRGIYVIESLEPPLLEVLSYLSANKPSALDRAVTRVKEAEVETFHFAEFASEGRLALLLGDLATLQASTHKVSTLTSIVRVCVDWADLIAPGADALSEVKARAESDPDWGGFAILASLAGDVAAGIDDGMSDGPMKCLLTIAQYALAWSAKIIEEEDK